jgi:BirA family biotin operon repressor/biotin-[acetyl-CoA-carboxylase] ligase
MWAIESFETLDSTQTYLVEAIRSGRVRSPRAVITRYQHAGRGSRSNTWTALPGDFLASIAVDEVSLPDDVPAHAASIYFGWLMRETLHEAGASDVWLKWPNDLYRDEEKIGGIMTQRLRQTYIAGIGINLSPHHREYAALPDSIDPMILLNMFLRRLETPPRWKHLFRKMQIEFEKSRTKKVHVHGAVMSLREAVLCEDGTLEINGKRIESLR